MTATATTLATGRIVAIAGPVVDVEFPPNAVPEINTALEFTLTLDGTEVIVVAEVAQQIGDHRIRAIAMKPTDGLTRGQPVTPRCATWEDRSRFRSATRPWDTCSTSSGNR